MRIQVDTTIAAPRDRVWATVTDIENSVNTVSGIEEIEVLERPADGLVGLKWREVRTMFGKQAEETMWISEATAPAHYKVEAKSHGAHYVTHIRLEDQGGSTHLSMDFGGIPQGFMAKLLSATMGRLFAGATRKALQQDLDDIKAAIESRPA